MSVSGLRLLVKTLGSIPWTSKLAFWEHWLCHYWSSTFGGVIVTLHLKFWILITPMHIQLSKKQELYVDVALVGDLFAFLWYMIWSFKFPTLGWLNCYFYWSLNIVLVLFSRIERLSVKKQNVCARLSSIINCFRWWLFGKNCVVC